MLSPSVIAWIERAMEPGARVVEVTPLQESGTGKLRVEIAGDDGVRQRVALRLGHDPSSQVADEALALRLLAGSRVQVPRSIAIDSTGAVCGVPALLESWLPGVPGWDVGDLDEYVSQAAAVLVDIHAMPVPRGTGLQEYTTYRDREPLISPPFSVRHGLWERVAGVLAGARPRHREAFIHRDYHPGNVLWNEGRVSGVVDWAEAAIGPPGIDLARMRLNLACRFDSRVADRFVDAYVSAGGDPSAHDSYWDLLDASDLLLDVTPGDEFMRLESFVERLLAGK